METIAKRRLLFAERPDSFTAVGYQPPAFSQVLENRETLKKWTRLEKARDGTIQNALTCLLLCLPWPPVWAAQWGMHQESAITQDYSMHQKKTCPRSQVQHFPLTHKTWNATDAFGKRSVGKRTFLAELFQAPPTFCWQENPRASCAQTVLTSAWCSSSSAAALGQTTSPAQGRRSVIAVCISLSGSD